MNNKIIGESRQSRERVHFYPSQYLTLNFKMLKWLLVRSPLTSHLSPVSGELEPEGRDAGCMLRPGPGEKEGGEVVHCPPGVQPQWVRLLRDNMRVLGTQLDQQHCRTNQAQLLQQQSEKHFHQYISTGPLPDKEWRVQPEIAQCLMILKAQSTVPLTADLGCPCAATVCKSWKTLCLLTRDGERRFVVVSLH